MFTIDEIAAVTGGNIERRGSAPRTGGVSIDSRTVAAGQVFVAIRGDTFDGNDFCAGAIASGASCVVCEKKARILSSDFRDATVIRVRDGLAALSALAVFHRRRRDIPVIAVTGSNGKTTTKDLCACCLEGSFDPVKTQGTRNNHIGLPLTLLQIAPAHTAAVLELGTNHFGEIAGLAAIARPTIGVITSIGPSHLAYFRNLSGVFREKSSLLKYLTGPAVAIVNADDPFLSRTIVAKKRKPFIISIGVRGPADFRARAVTVKGARLEFTLGGRSFRLRTPGRHNVYNALAAIAAGRLLGVSYGDMARRLADFEFPRGRLSLVNIGGTTFIDDSYNSSPASLRGALDTLREFRVAGRKILVIGDMLELGPGQEGFHREAGREAARFCSCAVAVGQLARLSLAGFRAKGKETFACDTAEEAKEIVLKRLGLTRRDVVLIKGSRRMKLDVIVR